MRRNNPPETTSRHVYVDRGDMGKDWRHALTWGLERALSFFSLF